MKTIALMIAAVCVSFSTLAAQDVIGVVAPTPVVVPATAPASEPAPQVAQPAPAKEAKPAVKHKTVAKKTTVKRTVAKKTTTKRAAKIAKKTGKRISKPVA